MKKRYKTVLTIAGSDCSGGAGIQADIKTISANGGYAVSVVTALTAQNTQGVSAIVALPPTFVAAQLDAVFSDIRIDAVKVGMVFNQEILQVVSEKLKTYKPPYVIVDPVIFAKGGKRLIEKNLYPKLAQTLFPMGSLITPNLLEAEIFYQGRIDSKQMMLEAVRIIGEKYATSVLLKGGHLMGDQCYDVLYQFHDKSHQWFVSDRFDTPNTHGTGCTLSSAIATLLAKGNSIIDSVGEAKVYVTRAIKSGMDYQLGSGHGPVNHFFDSS